METLNQVLIMYRNLNMKANYSELSRKYGISRQTISKYDKGFKKKERRDKDSKLDKYKEEITKKLSLPGATITGVYKFMKNKYPEDDLGCRSNFDTYVRSRKLIKPKTIKARPRYETPLGKQMQFDYKESMTMISKHGEVFKFNIFTSVLSASRMVKFTYSKTKTKEDIIRCLIESFEYFGGVTEEILTDNMTGIVNTKTKKFTNEFIQFCLDFNTKAKKCKVRTPQTKGKVESANRFINRLIPYQGEFETEEELIEIINKLSDDVNKEENGTTNIKPNILHAKEKEYLLPLPRKEIINSYLSHLTPVKVDNDSMINYKGKRYSVQNKFINKTLKVEEFENKLYIHDNINLVRIHYITDKYLNYNEDDYKNCLKAVMPYKAESDIEEMTKINLSYLDNIRR